MKNGHRCSRNMNAATGIVNTHVHDL